MAELEIGPLSERLSDEDIADLARYMEKLGAPQLPRSEDRDSTPVDALDDDVLVEFFERLEVHDAAAEIYLPIEFDGALEVAQLRVASAPVLLDVLEELKDELDVDADEDDEDEDEDDADFDEDRRILEAQLRQAWKIFYAAAKASVERKLPLLIKS